MIKTTPHKIATLMGILLSPSVLATDINVEFTATVRATTCNITLTGNNVTNDGNNNYTLRIPNMGLDKIANKTTESQADFKLVASGCSSGISWIDTTLTGNASSSSPKLIIPLSGDTNSTTSYIGMGFKRRNTDDATFLKPNSAEKIRWDTGEIPSDKGLEMTVALRETSQGAGVPGNFRALATFNFIYQ
ncbi:fimbrial protein [Escherichia sp. E2748]|uniref:fimbrial protein n=1 Tax=Escherichia sp. E2748 TaxID=2044460 RepID=UPI001082020A|nr:fimbrial protein [Escherichia sp. E2748]TGB96470.1 fimbrial protein [Escherichia sp. E2748]TLI81173.1 fimbrial protein [Escherichia sp. E2748]